MLLENQWTTVNRVEEWKTYKRRENDQNWHRFGAGLGGSDTFVSQSFYQQNVQKVILYSSVLFIPKNKRDNGILCLLVITRGLLDSIGSEDTW